MITIEYTPTGLTVSDFELDAFVQSVKNTMPFNATFPIANQLAILAIRVAISKDEIDYTKIQFKYEDQIILANEYGKIDDWFWDDVDLYLTSELVSNAIEKGKQNNAIS